MPAKRDFVLIAGHDPARNEYLRSLFSDSDVDIETADWPEEALRKIRAGSVDVLLLDADPADPFFATTLSEIKTGSSPSKTRVVSITDGNGQNRSHALDLGVDDAVTAPFEPMEVLARVRAQLRTRHEFIAMEEKVRLSEESWQVAQTAFQSLAVTEKMTRDAFSLERALKIGVGALFALALVVGAIFLLFSRKAEKETTRAYSYIARLEKGIQTQQQLMADTQKARQDIQALEAQQKSLQDQPSAPMAAAKGGPTGESPEAVIRTYAPSVCLIHVSVEFLDKDSGRPLRYGGIGPEGPYKDSDGNVVYTLEGRAPEVRQDFFGTGFIVANGKILTNHHVAEPWWENEEMANIAKQGLRPAIASIDAYFPESSNGVKVEIAQVSHDADLALLAGDLTQLKRNTLKLDSRKDAAISGQALLSLGYATGLSAILARASDSTVQEIVKVTGGEPKGVIDELAKRKLIRPLVTQGHIGDVLPDRIVYDAQTTSGGSGGPLINHDGDVIGVTFAVVRGFGGSNFGVPIRYAEPLIGKK